LYVALAQEFLDLAMEHLNIAAKPRLNIAAFGGVSTPSDSESQPSDPRFFKSSL